MKPGLSNLRAWTVFTPGLTVMAVIGQVIRAVRLPHRRSGHFVILAITSPITSSR